MKRIYFHPMKGASGAPPGAIGMSDNPEPTGKEICGLIAIDPHGMICAAGEAEHWAEELCRRWNEYPEMGAVIREAVEAERMACADLAREHAAKGWGTAPLNALAAAIEARGQPSALQTDPEGADHA
ncbi:hypothetical protein [Telmatospirillum sp. J64-1]|uniref:hypothetical protein n=1 Tax=Telmatospirillum sp. J64-1 TaxID=2502183 RepID=UPI00115CC932|nr:hypothetical protein [Telmatospirillum sp. J64-1]